MANKELRVGNVSLDGVVPETGCGRHREEGQRRSGQSQIVRWWRSNRENRRERAACVCVCIYIYSHSLYTHTQNHRVDTQTPERLVPTDNK